MTPGGASVEGSLMRVLSHCLMTRRPRQALSNRLLLPSLLSGLWVLSLLPPTPSTCAILQPATVCRLVPGDRNRGDSVTITTTQRDTA